MKFPMKAFTDGMEAILRIKNVKSVTVFVPAKNDTKFRVRLTRTKKSCNEIFITYGKPNYAEREFLKQCKRAKCHPKRMWLKYFPEKKRR